MIRRGYVEEMIEAFGAVLSRLLLLKEERDFSGALTLIQSSSKSLAGLDVDTLARMPDETLLTMLDPAQSAIAAALLDEQAQIYADRGDTGAAGRSNRKALLLFLEALGKEKGLRTSTLRERADRLIAQQTGPPSPAMLQRLARYHEAVGSYGRAEDSHFALRESGDADARKDAAAFYQRLQHLPDSTLIAGGLPRDEVDDGLAQIVAESAKDKGGV